MKTIKSINQNMSMKWKFSILYTFLIIIPIMIVGVISYRYTVSTTVQQAEREDALRIQEYKQSVQSVIDNTENMLDGIILRSDARTYMNNTFVFNEEEGYHFTYIVHNELIRIKNMYPNQYYNIRFFSSNKSLGEMNDFLYDIERIEGLEIYEEIVEEEDGALWGAIKVAEIYEDATTYYNDDMREKVVLPYYHKVFSYKNNDLIGIIEVDILLDKMFLNTYYNESVYLLDGNNEMMPVNRDHHQLGDGFNILLEKESGITEQEIMGDRYRITYDTIPELDCKVAVIRLESDLLKSMDGYGKQLVIITILSIILSFFIIYFMTKFMFTNFSALVKTIDKIRIGELSARLKVEGGEEISKLAKNFNLLLDELDEVIIKLMEKEMAQRDAEIKALQSQVNPHFLYNTLDSVRMQCEIREQFDIADVLISISRLFRYNTKWTNEMVCLDEEIEHTNNYMTIMKARFEGKISYKNNLTFNTHSFRTIKMILQPIVENCFKYAFNQKQEEWLLQLDGNIEEDDLILQISDNGSGISEDRLMKINRLLEDKDNNEVKESVGLWNLSRRIKIHFGVNYGIKVYSELGEGTTVIVKLPVILE